MTSIRSVRVCLAFTAAILAAPYLVSAAPTLASGTDATATLKGAVRYRNLISTSGAGGAKEVSIGLYLDSTPTNGDVAWGATGQCVQFSYNGTTLTTKLAPIATPCSFASATTFSKTVGSLASLNYLEISITKNTPTTSLGLAGLSVNGTAVGSVSKSGAAGTSKWKITGADLTSAFTVTGTVALSGLSGGGDSNYIEIDVGYVDPPDNQGPITSNVAIAPTPVLLNAEGTVTANVDDSTTGGNTIASATYAIDGGTGAAMAADDGTFDEVSEDVTATFTATAVGTHQVCVEGTDSLSNVGAASCQSYLVTYDFAGFFAPIDTGLLNSAKAGQSVPAKWRLTDGLGAAIDNPASFTGLYSYEIDCLDFQGDVLDSIEEYAAGSSGLQYNGDGYWQFNWKTPKGYVGTCRAMYVLFDSGATSPVVKFQFK